jgi:peptidoglycan/xylan/chitin deacetylase (PgdA/CDA1 family)
MSKRNKILSLLYPFIRFINYVFKKIKIRNNNELIVLLYHDISEIEAPSFKKQLIFIRKYWNFITPQEFEYYMVNKDKVKGRNVIITFDDGFYSNYLVAKSILSEFNIKALFFINPKFISCNNINESKSFIANRIFKNLSVSDIPEHWKNMSWIDVKTLFKEGHCIGHHTYSHADLGNITDQDILNEEIVSSAYIIESHINYFPIHFAFPFGTINNFSKQALKISKEKFKYIHTGLRGDNYKAPTECIRRHSFNPNDSNWLIGFFLEGGGDFMYKRSLSDYNTWY